MGTFRWLTAGESHGQGLTIILEGVPSGLPLSEDQIAKDLVRRQGGYGRGGRQQIERDRALIRSGVRRGFTIGSPIAMWIENRDWPNWDEVMSVAPVDKVTKRAELDHVTRLRPGHADLAGTMKYGIDNVRDILERSSARETASRVAAGAIARALLAEFGVRVHSRVLSIGRVRAEATPPETVDWERVERSPVRCHDPKVEADMIATIDAAKNKGDTVGGVFEVVAVGVPVGLGSHTQWDLKLDGKIAQAFMSIHAVKGVGIGDGIDVAGWFGSESHDVILPPPPGSHEWKRQTNHAGGLEGGMSTGMPIVARGYLKPIATLATPLPSVDLITGEAAKAHYERSDVCVVPAAAVIGEAMMALVLGAAWMEKFGGDSMAETRRNVEAYVATVGPRGRQRDAAPNWQPKERG